MRLRAFTLIFLSISIVGCSQIYGPVKEVEAYGAAMEPVMEEMMKTITADAGVSGIDKATKQWEAKKADLKAKRDAIDAGPKGMNADWQSLYFKIQDRARQHLDSIELKVDYDVKDKFKPLRSDIESTLKLR